ncbi:MAG: glycosyltransferase family 4 protein [Fuerstiella sp.]
MRPIRLTLLTDGLPPYVMGGMQTHSLNMAKSLAKSGVQVDVYHVVPDGDSDAELQRNNLITHRFAPPQRQWYPGHYIAEQNNLSADFLSHYAKQPPADIIYAKGLTASAFLKAQASDKISLPPVITNIHGYESFQPAATFMEHFRGALLRPAFRYVIEKSDYVVSYGGKVTDLLTSKLGVPAGRVLEISGAVDDICLRTQHPTARKSSESSSRRFAFVGRYERRKGLQELAAALHGIDIANHEFHLIGPIPDSILNRFPTFVQKHGPVSDRNRLIALLDNMDIVVCPSWSEGMPNVIMEAMARQCSIIATDVGAVRCLVDDTTGWLILPRDSRALKTSISSAMDIDHNRLAAMKSAARNRVTAEYSWSSITRSTIDCLRHVLNESINSRRRNHTHSCDIRPNGLPKSA